MPNSNNSSFNFMDAFGRFSDLLLVSIVFFISCIPLVTIGPAITSLYHTVVKSIRRERGKVLDVYFSCLRSNFKQGFLLGLICVGYLIIGLADVYLLQVYGHMHNAVQFFYMVTWLYMLPLALIFPWLFSYLSRFNDTIGHILKSALILCVTKIGVTLLCLLILAVGVFICCLVPLFIPLVPGPLCLLLSKQTEPVFKQLTQNQPVAHGIDDWYNE